MKVQAYQYNICSYKNQQSNLNFRANIGKTNFVSNESLQIIRIPVKYVENFEKDKSYSVEQVKTLLDLRLAGNKKRDVLSSFNNKVSDEDLLLKIKRKNYIR